MTRKISRVLSCAIYTIIGKYVCIYYLGSEKSKLIDLVMFDIYNHEKGILAVGYKTKQFKLKTNGIN